MHIEKPQNKNRRVQWDEDKLKETEKDRGKYQKIDQPKTPYRKNSQDSLQEMDIEHQKSPEQLQIQDSLKTAQKNKQVNKRHKIDLTALNEQLKSEMNKYNSPQEMDQQQNEEQLKKREQFKKKRASHYNQFQMVRQAQKNNWEDSDDEC